ncbi:hypothetical protein Taro_051819 [Colocasia esculenta]|uniref:Uncharacterized protein n=1 Tax=Colocasia esculenta TaxID=4460 RepID=A0A843XHU4_COLES|nr:hypothetical protein [Colocasia esculenta]
MSWGRWRQASASEEEEKGWEPEFHPSSSSAASRTSTGVLSGPGEERPNVVMRNQRRLMGQGKSDEQPPYEELIVLIASMAAERAQARNMQQTIQNLTQAILQATQGGGNREAGDLHQNFRNMDPPRFEGSTDPDVAEHWVKVVMRNQRRLMGQGKSDEQPPYEELIV